MFNDKAINTIYNKYNCYNIRQAEEYVNICRPDKQSEVYKQFNKLITEKVNAIMQWLNDKNIEYIWNNWIDGHLYRLYIPIKDLLLDFEFYPVINSNYNYIRVNYNTDPVELCQKIFPETILNTEDLSVWKLNQKTANRFLKDNGSSPIYDNTVLRLALAKNSEIYQCIIIKADTIIRNVCKKNTTVKYGTFILLRQLTEVFEIPNIIIKETSDDSYTNMMYQLIGTSIAKKHNKKKIWWRPNDAKWHINMKDSDKYVPFYFTENIIYSYKLKGITD